MARQHVEQPSTARKPGHNQSGLNVERRTVIRPDAPDNSMRRWGRPVVKLVVVVVVMSVALLHWDGGAAFFLGLLAASVIGLIDGRLSIAVGLLAIAACPLLLIANREAWLQQSTLVNYYLPMRACTTLVSPPMSWPCGRITFMHRCGNANCA
jgi:hypothetical protein